MILICSAWKEENKYLELDSAKFKVLNLGIGYLEAALNLEQELQILKNQGVKIQQIIFLATAGKIVDAKFGEFNPETDIQVYSIKEVYLGNYLTHLNYSYVPKEYESYQVQLLDCDLGEAIVISNLEITKNYDLNEAILCSMGRDQPLLENMEIYGAAKVAKRHNIEFSSLLATTNYTSPNASQDWKENHKLASKLLCRTYQELLIED